MTNIYEPDLTDVERKLVNLVLHPDLSLEVKALRIRTILGDVRQHVLIGEVEGYFDGFADGLANGLGEDWVTVE